MTSEGIQSLSILMEVTIFLINFLVISTDSKAWQLRVFHPYIYLMDFTVFSHNFVLIPMDSKWVILRAFHPFLYPNNQSTLYLLNAYKDWR